MIAAVEPYRLSVHSDYKHPPISASIKYAALQDEAYQLSDYTKSILPGVRGGAKNRVRSAGRVDPTLTALDLEIGRSIRVTVLGYCQAAPNLTISVR